MEADLGLEAGTIKADAGLKEAFNSATDAAFGVDDKALPAWAIASKVRVTLARHLGAMGGLRTCVQAQHSWRRHCDSMHESMCAQPCAIGKRVVVIGAGPSGLSAALHLQRQGATVTCVEARDRVGGRVHTVRNVFSGPVDFGAQLCTGERSPRGPRGPMRAVAGGRSVSWSVG